MFGPSVYRITGFSLAAFALLACEPSVQSNTPTPQERLAGPSGTTRGEDKPKPTAQPLPASIVVAPVEGVDFGAIEIGKKGEAAVRLLNNGEVPATRIDGSTIEPTFGFKETAYPGSGGTCGAILEPGETCVVTLSFVPTRSGPTTTPFTISFYDGVGQSSTLITLKGEGVLPQQEEPQDPVDPEDPEDPIDPVDPVTPAFEELGTYRVTTGRTQVISVEVGSDLEAITLVAKANVSSHYVMISDITSPNGVVLATGWSSQAHQNRSYFNNGVQATQIPQTPDINNLFVPGTYTFRVWVEDKNEVNVSNEDVRVWVGRRKAADSKSKINVNFFFSGSAGLTAQTALTQTRFKNAKDDFVLLFQGLGLEIDQLRYFNIATSYQDIVGEYPGQFAGGKKSMAELWSLGASSPEGLNIFFTDSVDPDNSGSGSILGIAGGIPGPSKLMDTTRSGVIVLYDSSTVFAGDDLGATIAHEAGHYLGLWHNKQQLQNGSYIYDNLSDTPTGTTATSNCMFWASHPSARDFSAMQREAASHHLLVH